MKFTLKNFGLWSIAGMISLASCNENAGTTSSAADSSGSDAPVENMSPQKDSSVKDSNAAKIGNTNPDQATIDFMVPGNAKELAWLMAGQKNGSSRETRDHSTMMIADHKKLGRQVGDLIAGKNLTAPPVDTMGVVNLTEPKGKEWDKAWVDKMVKDHQELLDKLKQSEKEVMDSSLKKLVINTQPVVQAHLEMVKMLQNKMK